MEFKIPLRREDLLSTTNCTIGEYVVKEVLTTREIYGKQEECRIALNDQGSSFILEHFDVFYSCVCVHVDLKADAKYDLWSILIKGFNYFISDLSQNLEDVESLDDDTHLRLLNILKMYIYLFCQWMPIFDGDAHRQNVLPTKRGKPKRVPSKENSKWDWNHEQGRFIHSIQRLEQCSFHKLWKKGLIEEEFLNLLFNCCYKILENVNICRSREHKEAIFNFLGGLLKTQKYSIGHAVKIVQLLQLFEHLAAVLAQAVVIFVNNHQMKQLLSDIIREIGNSTAQNDLQNNVGYRSFSLFLAEVAKYLPTLVLANISYLASHLDGESYCMRNCVLGIMGEILLQTSPGTDSGLDDRSRLLREQFLDHLEDHIHDVNAFVRSRCLQIWAQLSESQAIPIARQQRLMDMVIDRLQDKSCSVRKCAIHFLTAILQSNSFASKISLSELEESFDKEKVKLQEMAGTEDVNMSLHKNDVQDIDMTDESNPNAPDNNVPVAIAKQKVLLHYLKDSIAFAKAVTRALPHVCRLLSSDQVTDVMEAITFFVTTYKFGVHNSIIGIQKMLNLVWSKEQDLKTAVVTAYKKLYLNDNENKKIVKNLMSLSINATIGEIASLEKLIHDLVDSGDINTAIIDTLWKVFYNQDKYSKIESHAAIVLIGMVASSQIEMVEQKMNIIVDVGLGERATSDFYYTRDVCNVILKLCADKPSADVNKKSFCLPHDNVLFQRLALIVIGGINSKGNDWIGMVQPAIDVIYKLSDKPDAICEDILRAVIEELKNKSANVDDHLLEKVPSKLLANILLLSCHIAIRQMLYLEVSIFNELKRRRNIVEEENIKSKIVKNRRRSRNVRESLRESMIESSDDNGLNSAVAEDADADFIRNVCDKDLLTGDRFLSTMAQITVKVAGDPVKYCDSKLQTSSALALTKFMMVSHEFCDANIQLLFTILEKSKLPNVRATVMIAICDLACRFPNVIEPWTSHIFKRVRDDVFEVRENSIAVLGHLLLNDMIKVKGCVSDVALCIVDKDSRIEMKAKQLFYDLSQKSNAIFNLLPDIIGRLLDAEVGTTEENFQAIMKYLLNFVKKDRLLESLVEKISHRFSVVRLEWQWRSLAFCLTLICENEKCCKKLLENMTLFQEALVDDTVYNCFLEIIAKAKKVFKLDLQSLVDDLEEQLTLNRKKAVGEDYVEKEKTVSTLRPKARRKFKSQTRATTKMNEHSEARPEPLSRTLRSRKVIPPLELSSDDDFE